MFHRKEISGQREIVARSSQIPDRNNQGCDYQVRSSKYMPQVCTWLTIPEVCLGSLVRLSVLHLFCFLFPLCSFQHCFLSKDSLLRSLSPQPPCSSHQFLIQSALIPLAKLFPSPLLHQILACLFFPLMFNAGLLERSLLASSCLHSSSFQLP